MRFGCAVNPPIGQSFADDAVDRKRHALRIRHLAGVVAKIEFCRVSVTELGGCFAGRDVVSGGRDVLLTLKAKSNLLDQL